MRQKNFRVRWEIDLVAATPADAARQALAIHRDPGSLATFFDVRRIRLDGTKGKRHGIDAQAHAYSDAAETDQEARMLREGPYAPTPDPKPNCARTHVVDGVTYAAVPETQPCSCVGCVALDHLALGNLALCRALNYVDCDTNKVIWAVSESKPETPTPPKRGTVLDLDNASAFNQCVDPVVDGVLYRAVDALPGDECEGCAGGAYGPSLCSELPCCGSGGRDDGRNLIFVEVQK